MMKFVKISSRNTESELEEVYNKMSQVEKDTVKSFYERFDYEIFTDSDGYQCMFMSIHDNYLSELMKIYSKYSLDVSCQDFTKEALFNTINFSDQPVTETTLLLLIYTAKVFRDINLDIDVVLDKISEMGESSLTNEDKQVLLKF